MKHRSGGIRYISGSSYLHRLNPVTKAAALIILSAAALLTQQPLPLALMLALVTTAALACDLFRPFIRAMRLFIPLLIFILVIDAFFSRVVGGTIWFSAEIWLLHPTLSTDGLLFSIAMGLRLLLIGGASVLFMMTTPYSDFVGSLRAIGLPNTLAFSLGYALRSISALSSDIEAIMDAQRSRALEFDRGTIVHNRHKMMALFIPATVTVLSRAKQVSEAMQCRGFGCSSRVTCWKTHPFGREDIVLLVLVMACVPLVLLLS
ncbi:energy-coupling factor transporter transmembrane component T family protein [Methanofollis fontis]|uniref:Energy-coupling factor transporter transmembrane protein EcfT n=1 Tax=Methanofollis fontis TaxID=2052832 RepID=A0A483CUG8_9EURY|nr:energy-coupling factor transporter transmembrane component T [Methanofollis fontis]TAJ44547.1 hypothetical protein CUJ86_04325 [Methanofollis fontis]